MHMLGCPSSARREPRRSALRRSSGRTSKKTSRTSSAVRLSTDKRKSAAKSRGRSPKKVIDRLGRREHREDVQEALIDMMQRLRVDKETLLEMVAAGGEHMVKSFQSGLERVRGTAIDEEVIGDGANDVDSRGRDNMWDPSILADDDCDFGSVNDEAKCDASEHSAMHNSSGFGPLPPDQFEILMQEVFDLGRGGIGGHYTDNMTRTSVLPSVSEHLDACVSPSPRRTARRKRDREKSTKRYHKSDSDSDTRRKRCKRQSQLEAHTGVSGDCDSRRGLHGDVDASDCDYDSKVVRSKKGKCAVSKKRRKTKATTKQSAKRKGKKAKSHKLVELEPLRESECQSAAGKRRVTPTLIRPVTAAPKFGRRITPTLCCEPRSVSIQTVPRKASKQRKSVPVLVVEEKREKTTSDALQQMAEESPTKCPTSLRCSNRKSKRKRTSTLSMFVSVSGEKRRTGLFSTAKRLATPSSSAKRCRKRNLKEMSLSSPSSLFSLSSASQKKSRRKS